MSLRNLAQKDDIERNQLIKNFIDAPLDQNFPQEMVALYLDCSPWTLAKMRCEKNSIPFRKVGRRVTYKKRDVLDYEQSQTVTSTAQYQAIAV